LFGVISLFCLVARVCDNSGLLRKQLIDGHEQQALELESRRLSELQLTSKPLSHHSYFGYSMDGLKLSEGLISLCT
jgi:hypothetical protein